MALTLPTSLPPTRSGRTFFVALCLLGVGALVQLAVMAVFLLRGGIAGRNPTLTAAPVFHFAETLQPGAPGMEAATALSPTLPTPAPPLENPPGDAVQNFPPGTTATRPIPNSTARFGAGSGDLLEQARQLRTRGDIRSALARLREAEVAEPDDPQIIAEMALTYEGMQVPDRAYEQWQRIYAMGESIGALYYLADAKLHNAPTAQSGPGRPAFNPGAAGNADPGGAGEGAVLKLTEIHKEDLDDPTAEQKFALKIVVKGKPGVVIDPNKVRILTYFYDLVDGRDVLLTDAQTGYAWLTPAPVNWANDKSEVLETTYLRPKASPGPVPAATPPPEGADAARSAKGKARRGKAVAEATPAATPAPTAAPVRTYLGYTVRLYYDRQLQDVQADPVRLMQQFPPPTTLPND